MLTHQAVSQKWSLEDIRVYDAFEELAPLINASDNEVHIVNFWATWCKPCVAELPYFEALLDEGGLDNVRITLVSLDFKHQIGTKLLDFLNEHSIRADVVVLTDGNSNAYIDKVDESWEGSIPATIFLKGDKRLFFEKSFHSVKELTDIINSIN